MEKSIDTNPIVRKIDTQKQTSRKRHRMFTSEGNATYPLESIQPPSSTLQAHRHRNAIIRENTLATGPEATSNSRTNAINDLERKQSQEAQRIQAIPHGAIWSGVTPQVRSHNSTDFVYVLRPDEENIPDEAVYVSGASSSDFVHVLRPDEESRREDYKKVAHNIEVISPFSSTVLDQEDEHPRVISDEPQSKRKYYLPDAEGVSSQWNQEDDRATVDTSAGRSELSKLSSVKSYGSDMLIADIKQSLMRHVKKLQSLQSLPLEQQIAFIKSLELPKEQRDDYVLHHIKQLNDSKEYIRANQDAKAEINRRYDKIPELLQVQGEAARRGGGYSLSWVQQHYPSDAHFGDPVEREERLEASQKLECLQENLVEAKQQLTDIEMRLTVAKNKQNDQKYIKDYVDKLCAFSYRTDSFIRGAEKIIKTAKSVNDDLRKSDFKKVAAFIKCYPDSLKGLIQKIGDFYYQEAAKRFQDIIHMKNLSTEAGREFPSSAEARELDVHKIRRDHYLSNAARSTYLEKEALKYFMKLEETEKLAQSLPDDDPEQIRACAKEIGQKVENLVNDEDTWNCKITFEIELLAQEQLTNAEVIAEMVKDIVYEIQGYANNFDSYAQNTVHDMDDIELEKSISMVNKATKETKEQRKVTQNFFAQRPKLWYEEGNAAKISEIDIETNDLDLSSEMLKLALESNEVKKEINGIRMDIYHNMERKELVLDYENFNITAKAANDVLTRIKQTSYRRGNNMGKELIEHIVLSDSKEQLDHAIPCFEQLRDELRKAEKKKLLPGIREIHKKTAHEKWVQLYNISIESNSVHYYMLQLMNDGKVVVETH